MSREPPPTPPDRPTSYQPPAYQPPPYRPPPGGAAHGPRLTPGRLFVSLLLIVAGIMALLANFGLVSGQQLARALELWPAALILLGLALIFRAWLPRLAVPLAAVLVLVLLVGALAYTAMPPAFQGATVQSDYSAQLGAANEGRLDLSLAASNLSVQAQDMPDLYRARFDYPRGRSPHVSADGGTLSIGGSSGFTLFGPQGATRGRVMLNGSIPWTIDVGGGASQISLDLGGVQLKELDVSGGANRLDATLSRPSGTVPIRISGGATNVTLHRPSGTPASAVMTGGANNLTADGKRFNVFGSDVTWRSAEFDSASDRYEIVISGGASNVTLDQR